MSLLRGKVVHQGGPLLDDVQQVMNYFRDHGQDMSGYEIFKQGSMRIRTVVGYGPVSLVKESSLKFSKSEGDTLLHYANLIE
jgi:hypothetical protein